MRGNDLELTSCSEITEKPKIMKILNEINEIGLISNLYSTILPITYFFCCTVIVRCNNLMVSN